MRHALASALLLAACHAPAAGGHVPAAGGPVPAAGGQAPAAGGHPPAAGMPHRFEDAARWAAVFDDPARDAWQRPEAVLAALALAPAMRVADLGAGTGYFTVRLARALPAGRVVATDVEPDMVRYLAARAAREGLGNVDVALATAEDPGLAPGSLDRVLVVDVWHHVPDRRRLAAQLAAALRPGGRVVVVDFTAAARQGPPPAHRLAPGAVADDLRGAGLEVSVAEDALPEQYVVTGTRR